MITGAHSIIYSRSPEKDRSFFRDVLGLSSADAGGGWLIFGLPPSEVAFHPGRRNNVHELYLLCSDIRLFMREMRKRKVNCTRVQHRPWGRLTMMQLPGGGRLGVYEPLHDRPAAPRRRPR